MLTHDAPIPWLMLEPGDVLVVSGERHTVTGLSRDSLGYQVIRTQGHTMTRLMWEQLGATPTRVTPFPHEVGACVMIGRLAYNRVSDDEWGWRVGNSITDTTNVLRLAEEQGWRPVGDELAARSGGFREALSIVEALCGAGADGDTIKRLLAG